MQRVPQRYPSTAGNEQETKTQTTMKKTILTMVMMLAMMLAWSCEKQHSTTHYELMYNLNDSVLVKEQKMGDTTVLNYFKTMEGGRPIRAKFLHKIVEID